MTPKVIVLVLNWNRKDYTITCLRSLQEADYDSLEVVVIDNGSTDGSEAAIREAYPRIRIIQNGDNLGYAEGNNRGIQRALSDGADYVFIINNDTKIHPDCISHLVAAAEIRPDFGILAPLAYDYETGEKMLGSGYFLERTDRVPFAIKPCDGMSILKQNKAVFSADLVQGDGFFVRRQVFEKIGFFDSRFFLTMEEFDFCLRAQIAGFGVGVVGEAKFQRMLSPVLGKRGSPLRSYYETRNLLLLIAKHADALERKRRTQQILKRIKWDIEGYHLPNFFRTGDWDHLKNIMSILRGCADYFLGRFGRANVWQ